MTFVGRLDPSGTHAVLPMTPAVFTDGAWETLPAGRTTIECLGSSLGDAFVRVTYGKADVPGGGCLVRAMGKPHERGEPHLRFV